MPQLNGSLIGVALLTEDVLCAGHNGPRGSAEQSLTDTRPPNPILAIKIIKG